MPRMTNTSGVPTGFSENTNKFFTTETGALTKGYALFKTPGAVTVPPVTQIAVGTADSLRGFVAALPTVSNKNSFAGVLSNSYNAKAAGQIIELNCPAAGDQVFVYADGAVTIDTILWPRIADGKYSASLQGVLGKGAVRAKQTTSGAGLVQAEWICSDERDSGGVQTLTATAGAVTSITKGGTTVITGASIASNMTATLANGDYIGQRTVIRIATTAITTSVFVLTVTSGIHRNKATYNKSFDTLTTLTMSAVGNQASLLWNGLSWVMESFAGTLDATDVNNLILS